MFSLLVNKIKRITNDSSMDTEECSEMYRDKSFYSNKQVEFIRDNKKSINKFEEILATQEKAPTSEDG